MSDPVDWDARTYDRVAAPQEGHFMRHSLLGMVSDPRAQDAISSVQSVETTRTQLNRGWDYGLWGDGKGWE